MQKKSISGQDIFSRFLKEHDGHDQLVETARPVLGIELHLNLQCWQQYVPHMANSNLQTKVLEPMSFSQYKAELISDNCCSKNL